MATVYQHLKVHQFWVDQMPLQDAIYKIDESVDSDTVKHQQHLVRFSGSCSQSQS